MPRAPYDQDAWLRDLERRGMVRDVLGGRIRPASTGARDRIRARGAAPPWHHGARPSPSRPLTLTLPYPPSLNDRFCQAPDGTLHLRKAQRQYRTAVQDAVHAQWLQMTPRPVWPLTGRLTVTVWLYAPDRRKRDILDNPQKALWDALQHAGVLEDDSQIDEGHVYRGAVSPVPRVEISFHTKGEL